MTRPPPSPAAPRHAPARPALALAAALAAAGTDVPAGEQADCPAAADLPAGIYVAYDDGSLSRFVGTPGGRVVEDTFFDDTFSTGYRYVTAGGLYPLESYDIRDGAADPGSRTDTHYPDPAGGFPPPAAGLTWRAEAEVRSPRDGVFGQLITLSVGAAAAVRYGGCGYEVLPAVLRFQDEVADSQEHLDIVPALGIAIYRAGGVFGQDYEAHLPVAIARLPPAGMPAFAD